jgi:hypothetical protein
MFFVLLWQKTKIYPLYGLAVRPVRFHSQGSLFRKAQKFIHSATLREKTFARIPRRYFDNAMRS